MHIYLLVPVSSRLHSAGGHKSGIFKIISKWRRKTNSDTNNHKYQWSNKKDMNYLSSIKVIF